MFLKPLSISRGVAILFATDLSVTGTVTDLIQYRPDKVLGYLSVPSIKGEMINNFMSNISPLSMENGESYTVTGTMFNGYFGR